MRRPASTMPWDGRDYLTSKLARRVGTLSTRRRDLDMAPIPIADWTRSRQFLQALPYGKVLPSAIYVHRDTAACRTGHLADILALLARHHAVGEEFNVVKLRTDDPRLSFLCYPGFFDVAHPSLEEAVTIDLCSGRSLRTAYRDSLNPPILHRKELLLSPDCSATIRSPG